MALKDNPVLGQLMKQGEERVAKLATQLLASEKFVQVVQIAVQRALTAKGFLDKNLKLMLAAMNLPSTADIRALNERLDDLERLLGELEDRIDSVLDKNVDAADPEARA
jgi:polyhydroxyalkanoate synthesis regulator phasin